MGGGASKEPPSRKGSSAKPPNSAKPKTPKNQAPTTVNDFINCDRYKNEFDAEATKWRIFAILQNQQVKGSNEKLYIPALEHIQKAMARCANKYKSDVVSKIEAFMTSLSTSSTGIETLLVTGPSSSGVSIAITQAVISSATSLENRNATVVFRRIHPYTTTALELICDVCAQLLIPPPSCNDEIVSALNAVITAGTEDAPLLIILDGLNHLTDFIDPNLEWIVPVLCDCSNAFVRVVLSSTPYPQSPVELALCRSHLNAEIIALPPLSITIATDFLDSELKRSGIQSLPDQLASNVKTTLEIALDSGNGIYPCYLQCLVTGILIPYVKNEAGYEASLLLPMTAQEAFEQFLITLENNYLQLEESPKNVHPPIIIKPTRLEMDARKHMIIQLLSIITLSSAKGGISAADIQQILPQPEHPPVHLNGKVSPIPSVQQLLEHFLVSLPGSDLHLNKDEKGRWTWQHSLAKHLADYRYLNVRKFSDWFGSIDSDDETKRLAGVYLDWGSSVRKQNKAKGSRKSLAITSSMVDDNWFATTYPRLLCVAQRKNELLSQLLDLKFLILVAKQAGSVGTLVQRLYGLRRHALVEKGIFLKRERVEELDAILTLFERYRKVIQIGIREKCLDIVFKQILNSNAGDWGVVQSVVENFLFRLQRIEDGSGIPNEATKSLSNMQHASESTLKSSTISVASNSDNFWLFEPCRDLKVDVPGQEPITLIVPKKVGGVVSDKLATSADGRFAIHVLNENQIRAYEASPFKELWCLVSPDTVSAITTSPSGKTLAIAFSREIGIFKTASGLRIATIATMDVIAEYIAVSAPPGITSTDDPAESLRQSQKDDNALSIKKGLKVCHMVLSNETTLLISTQCGRITSWDISRPWELSQSYHAEGCEDSPPTGEVATFSVSTDGFACAWWDVKVVTSSSPLPTAPPSRKSFRKRSSVPTTPQSTPFATTTKTVAQLEVFNMSLDTPSNALSRRIHLELPFISSIVHFISKGDQLAIIDNDSLYCVDARSGDLLWTVTTLNAGLSPGNWVDICPFTDINGNEAVVVVSADGWAVDATGGHARWRMDLGLKQGDTIVSARSMNGHMPNQKYTHPRNQYAIGQHLVYSTRFGGLYACRLRNWPDVPPLSYLGPAIRAIRWISCDPMSSETVAVDSEDVLHIPTGQQVKLSRENEPVQYCAIYNQAVTVVTKRMIYWFPAFASESKPNVTETDLCALSNAPRTYSHSKEIHLCCLISSTLLVLQDATHDLVLLRLSNDANPTIHRTIACKERLRLLLFLDPVEPSVLCVTASGKIQVQSFSESTTTGSQPILVCENVFQASESSMAVDGRRSVTVESGSVSPTKTMLVLGDSSGNILIVHLPETVRLFPAENGGDGGSGGVQRRSGGVSGYRIKGACTSPVVSVLWINETEFLGAEEQGLVVIWRLENNKKKLVVRGVMDVGNFGVRTVDLVPDADGAGMLGKCRISVGGGDGRLHEYYLDCVPITQTK